jgi:hypothetical protein
MARGLVTEEESGTCRGWVHPHNGYYAGDFSTTHPVVARGAAAPRHLRVVTAPLVDANTTTEAGPVRWRDAA